MKAILEPTDEAVREQFNVDSSHYSEEEGVLFAEWRVGEAIISAECADGETVDLMAINHKLGLWDFSAYHFRSPAIGHGIRWVIERTQEALSTTSQQPNGD